MAGAHVLARSGLADGATRRARGGGGVGGNPQSGAAGPVPVVTPNGETLAWKVVDGVKVFHLIAGEFEHEFAPGLKARCWGYNGRTPGPTIELNEGDRVRIYVTNRLAEGTTVHWHGIFLPNGMDGVGGLTQRKIEPGETYRYEFDVRQHGTFMYHPHFDEMTQMALGMMGLIVVHPREATTRPEHDFAIMLSEWKVPVGAARPDPNEMTDFNVLTMNSKVFPATAPLVVRRGALVRLRLGNLGAMDHHPIHLHGHRFWVTATDGGQIPESARWPETTVLVPVGSTREVEFVADATGDWPMHCHMTHHIMTQMGHGVPNMTGVDAKGIDERVRRIVPGFMTMGAAGMGEMSDMGMEVPENSTPMFGGPGPFGTIDMGGMFTILKVREEVKGHEDPGWYVHPEGTLARPASGEEMVRDGVG